MASLHKALLVVLSEIQCPGVPCVECPMALNVKHPHYEMACLANLATERLRELEEETKNKKVQPKQLEETNGTQNI